MDQPYTMEEDGLCLTVRVTPRSSRSEVIGIVAGADGRPLLSIRLAAPPVDGAANKELVMFLARLLDLPRSAVSIRSGETGRVKRVRLSGDAPRLADRIRGI